MHLHCTQTSVQRKSLSTWRLWSGPELCGERWDSLCRCFRAGLTDMPLLGLGASLENQISATVDHRALPYPSLGSCCCLLFISDFIIIIRKKKKQQRVAVTRTNCKKVLPLCQGKAARGGQGEHPLTSQLRTNPGYKGETETRVSSSRLW